MEHFIEVRLNYYLNKKDIENVNKIFEQIYVSYFKLGLFVARQYLDEFEAEEVCEDTFVNFFSFIIEKQKCEIKNIKRYLCTTIKNNSIKVAKENEKKKQFNDDITYVIDKECDDSVKGLLNDLDELELYIITEHVLFDKTFKEISIELGKPLNTIKSIYRRSIIKIKKRIKCTKITRF